MNDNEFLAAFEQGTLPQFPHESHMRLAWLLLRAEGWDVGATKICAGLQHFVHMHHAPGKYHETITLFWARVIYHAIMVTPEIAEFTAFVERHPFLFDGKLINQHYSSALLQCSTARQSWVEPDLKPLPALPVEDQ